MTRLFAFVAMAALASGPLTAADTCHNVSTANGTKCVMVFGDDTEATPTSCLSDDGREASNCTANDLTFVITDLGVQDDGCYGPGDTAKIRLRSQIANTTAQTRYDLGLWFAVDGDPNGDGAITGKCDRAVLYDTRLNSFPANACNPTASEGLRGIEYCTNYVSGTCPAAADADALDIFSAVGDGPFDNADSGGSNAQDFCRDIRTNGTAGCDSADADTLRDNSLFDLPAPIEVPCADVSNAFLEIPACLSWGNNADDIDTSHDGVSQSTDNNSACDDATEIENGTAAKCTCQTIVTKVSVPNLALECKVWNGATSTWEDATTVRSGPFGGGNPVSMQVRVRVTYTNSASCDWSTTNSVRSRCGTSSMTRFDAADNVAASGSSDGGSYALDDDGQGRDVLVNTNESWRWYPNTDATFTDAQESVIPPQTDTTPGTTLNGYTDTAYYWYTVPTGLANNSTVTLNHTMVWFDKRCSNDAVAMCSTNADCVSPGTCQNLESTTAVNQPLTDACTLNISTTRAEVADFAVRQSGGATVVEWQTSSEIGTAGFLVERLDPETKGYTALTARPVPALNQLPGGRYRLRDETAPKSGNATYRVVEVDQQGQRNVLGSYTVELGRRGDRNAALDAFTAEAKATSPRLVASAEERRAAALGAAARIDAAAVSGSVNGAAAAASNGGGQRRARIGVATAGATRVPGRQLAQALGMPQAELAALLRAGQLRLTRGGEEVAWLAAPDGDGLVLYGVGLDTAYTTVDVYFAERGAGRAIDALAVQGSLGAGAPSFSQTLHLETDAIPTATAGLPVEDFWIWKTFFPGFAGFDRHTFAANVAAPASAGATLDVHVYGFAALQRADLRWNGKWLAELRWEGSGARTLSVAVPAGLLRDGTNKIEVFAREAERGFWIDSFDLTYQRRYRAAADRLDFTAAAGQAVELAGFGSRDVLVFDLADPLAPRRLEGASVRQLSDGSWGLSFTAPAGGPFTAVAVRSLARAATVQASAPADLLRPSRGGAEYLVIAPAELRNPAQRLVDHRAGQGMLALRVDLDDVFDLFGGGVYDPLAIRAFLAHALQSWASPPRYVVLAGKGTYDPKNLLGLYTNLLPTLLVTVQDGVAPADAALADVDDDGVPELALGRIPATTTAELDAYVDKLIDYESAPDAPWMDQALLVADDNDRGGNFAQTSQRLALGVGDGLAVSTIALPAGATPTQLAVAREEMAAAFRQGRLLVNYVGHGGLDRLASEGLLLSSDVKALGNGARQPVLTALTCLIAHFAYPSVTSLGEELVLQKDGGAAAVFGPTWLATNSGSGEMGAGIVEELSASDGGRLGDRVLRGLEKHGAAGGDAETARVYTLLGDPALDWRR